MKLQEGKRTTEKMNKMLRTENNLFMKKSYVILAKGKYLTLARSFVTNYRDVQSK